MKKTLKQRYELACQEYAEKFALKHNMEFEGWVGDRVGETAFYSNCHTVSIEVLRDNIDKEHPIAFYHLWKNASNEGIIETYREWATRLKKHD